MTLLPVKRELGPNGVAVATAYVLVNPSQPLPRLISHVAEDLGSCPHCSVHVLLAWFRGFYSHIDSHHFGNRIDIIAIIRTFQSILDPLRFGSCVVDGIEVAKLGP